MEITELQTAALKAAANGILIVNISGQIEWANPAAERMTGYKLDELIGQNPRMLKSGNHSLDYYQQMWNTILSGEIWQGETVNRRKDGSLYTEEQTITPVKDRSGQITHFIAIKQEISLRKQAEMALKLERQRLYELLEGLPAVVYLKAPDYSIRYANRLFRDYYGDPQGRYCYQLIRGRSEPCLDCQTMEIIQNQTPQFWERQHGDGRIFQTHNYPFTDIDGQKLVLVLSIDITDLSLAREELERTNQELLALSHDERNQRELAEALFQAALVTSTSLNPEELLDRILEQTLKAIPSRAALLLLVEGDSIRVARHRGLQDIAPITPLLTMKHPLNAFLPVEIIARSLKPLIVQDSYINPDRQNIPGLEWVQSYAAAPLLLEDRFMGIILLLSDQSGYFSSAVAGPLQAFAIHAGLGLRNADLFETEQRLRQETEVLAAALQALTQSMDLEHILDALLDYLDLLVTFDRAAIYLAQSEGVFRPFAARGYETYSRADLVRQHDLDIRANRYLRSLLKNKRSVLISDTQADDTWEHQPGDEHIRCWLAVPLLSGGAVIGLCTLAKTLPDFYTVEHQRLAETLVGQAAVIVQNAWLFEQLHDSREHLLALSHRLVEIQENERRYVARELHDEAGQALTSLKYGLSLLERQASDPSVVGEIILQLKRQVDDVMEELHRLAMDLRPVSLDHLGLKAALRQHLEKLGSVHDFQTRLVDINLQGRLPAGIETSLYRIIQEALTNVARHSKAKRVEVLIERRPHTVVAIVEDDGVGFDPENVSMRQSLGLFGMRERAEMLGGKLVVESQPGHGTTIYVEVPNDDSNPDR